MEVGSYMNKSVNNGQSKGGTPEMLLNQYKGKSESELMREMMTAISAQKKAGTFNKNSLSEFERQVAPHLNDSQKARLKQLMAML